MTELVRVKLENGAEATLSREFAELKGIEVLDQKPATDVRGVALNDKPHVTLASAGSVHDGKSVEELQAEVDARGLAVEGTGKDGRVLKSDLLTALVANDSATA